MYAMRDVVHVNLCGIVSCVCLVGMDEEGCEGVQTVGLDVYRVGHV